jgi:hypothetical protein
VLNKFTIKNERPMQQNKPIKSTIIKTKPDKKELVL